ncbi:hypothetical protein DL98DRAFT_150868 [Cadophora sp. DSE1049]|nr:hypothetical protein DL98DRAFT_150868 [Cadophora sp. DSE1049]
MEIKEDITRGREKKLYSSLGGGDCRSRRLAQWYLRSRQRESTEWVGWEGRVEFYDDSIRKSAGRSAGQCIALFG